MRIAEAFAKMRLSDFCSQADVDRAIAVTVDSFVGSQKVSAKKALARAFAKYVVRPVPDQRRGPNEHRYTLKRPERQQRRAGAGRGLESGPSVGTVSA
jgi:hypothetical protein